MDKHFDPKFESMLLHDRNRERIPSQKVLRGVLKGQGKRRECANSLLFETSDSFDLKRCQTKVVIKALKIVSR